MTHTFQLPDLAFETTTLDNGLDVIVRRQGPLPIVAVNLWYHVGSKNEERGQRGFAHLFEHLMFEGSEHYPGDFFKPLQRIGAGINGSTSSDRTNYYIDLPVAHIELALAMESDRMGHLLPALSEKKLRVQKDVVKNEYRQNYANRPYGQVPRILAEALYPAEHPYSWPTIGVMEEVDAATRDDVEGFFRRYYVPANASLCLVGEIDVSEALALADQYFGGFHGGMAAPRPRTSPVRLDDTLNLTYHDRVELERAFDVWPTVPMFDSDDAPLSLLSDVLARGQASRLYRRLVVDEQLVQSVSAQQQGRELAGAFHLATTLRPGKSSERVRAILLEEVAKVAELGVSGPELVRARNGRVAGFVYALDNVGGFGGVADRLNSYNTYTGDPARITTDVTRYIASTPEDLQRVARLYLAGKPRVSLLVTGKSSTSAAVVPALDRSVPPLPRAARAYLTPLPESRVLRCGVLSGSFRDAICPLSRPRRLSSPVPARMVRSRGG